MTRSFSLDTRVFSLHLFRWQHWEITSEHLFNNISAGRIASVQFVICKLKIAIYIYIYIYSQLRTANQHFLLPCLGVFSPFQKNNFLNSRRFNVRTFLFYQPEITCSRLRIETRFYRQANCNCCSTGKSQIYLF